MEAWLVMRYSELSTKEIVNIDTGEKLGDLQDLDLLIDAQSGKILNLIVPNTHSKTLNRTQGMIPWDRIHRFGQDMVLISSQCKDARDM